MEKVLRGNIYYADLDPVIGSEQGGKRPVLIIQNNIGNDFSQTVIVAPITKTITKLPTHVYLSPFEKIKYNSTILTEQLRAIDKKRLGSFLGRLPHSKMEEVNKKMYVAIGVKKV